MRRLFSAWSPRFACGRHATSGGTNNGTVASVAAAAPTTSAYDAVTQRRTCRRFDPDRTIPEATLERICRATTRAPTGFNLQPWTAVIAHSAGQRGRLFRAALSQPAVGTAPVVVVFAGMLDASAQAPQVWVLGEASGYYRPAYGPSYLRSVYYMLHGGPGNVMNVAKACLSQWYSQATGAPLLSVPLSPQSYAWKQAMIPAATMVALATAEGVDSCMLEGFDEGAVLDACGLPRDRFTVPVMVCLGYGATAEQCAALDGVPAFHGVASPRFPVEAFFHRDQYCPPPPVRQ